MAPLRQYLVTFKSGNYKVISSRNMSTAFLQAAKLGEADLCEVQEIPDTPEDWHEQEEQLLHTVG